MGPYNKRTWKNTVLSFVEPANNGEFPWDFRKNVLHYALSVLYNILCLILGSLGVMASFLEEYLERKMSFIFFSWPFPHSKNAFTTMVVYFASTAVLVYQLKIMHALISFQCAWRAGCFFHDQSSKLTPTQAVVFVFKNSKWPSSFNALVSDVQYFVFRSLICKCNQFDIYVKLLCRKNSWKDIKLSLGRTELIRIMS